MGHTYQSYRSTNLWSFCQLGAEMIGSFWQTNAPFKVWADQNKTDLSCVLQVLFQIWRSVFSSEAAHFIAHFRLVWDPFDAINDNSGDAVACDRFKMFRLRDIHTSLTAQPIYDPFVSLVQKWLEASGKQMLRHWLAYRLIRNKTDSSSLRGDQEQDGLVLSSSCSFQIWESLFPGSCALQMGLQLNFEAANTKNEMKLHQLFWNSQT